MLTSPLAALLLKLLFTVLALVVASRCTGTGAVWRSPAARRGAGGVFMGGLIGAKAGFCLQYPGVWSGESSAVWQAAAGLSAPGACAGAALGLALAARGHAAALAERLLAPALAFMLVLDLGALTWSLTEPGFGAATARWGINFGDGILRHPVMLYDAAAMTILLWMAWWAGGLGRVGVVPGLRAAMVGGACFGVWFLLAFLKPPFGPVLMLEAIYPRAARYPPGITGEQGLCLLALLVLCALGARQMIRGARRRGQNRQ